MRNAPSPAVVSLNESGKKELLERCTSHRSSQKEVNRLKTAFDKVATVIAVRPCDGSHFLKFPGVARHFAVGATSVIR